MPSWNAASAASASAEALLAVAVAAFSAIWASLRSSPAICAFWVAVAAVALTSASLTRSRRHSSKQLLRPPWRLRFPPRREPLVPSAARSAERWRQRPSGPCGLFRVVSSSSHLVHAWVDARRRVLRRSLSTFITLGNKHTKLHTVHVCTNRNTGNTSTIITPQLLSNLPRERHSCTPSHIYSSFLNASQPGYKSPPSGTNAP